MSDPPVVLEAADLSDEVLLALQDLAAAADAGAARRILRQYPALQQPGLDTLLTQMSRAAWEAGDAASAAVFIACRTFLARCRAAGADAALRAGPPLPLQRGGALGQLLLLGDEPAGPARRAEAARQALADLRADAEPDLWATVNDELADSLSLMGDADAVPRLEEAVAGYRRALTVWDHPPHAGSAKQARTQQALFTATRSLAIAYCERVDGERAQAIEKAIAHLTAVLEPPLVSPAAQPLAWGRGQMVLGNAYSARLRGSRKENLQRAVKYHQAALAAFSEPAYAEDRARAHHNLAIAYRQLPSGDPARNLRQALAYYDQALTVFTAESHPLEWAHVQSGRGDLYGQREFGGRPASLQAALACYQAARRVRTRARDPAGWATLENNLGNVYAEWAEDEQDSANQARLLAQAITHYEAALAERPRARFPTRWAETVNNLGVAYSQGPTADFERATGYLAQALKIHTPSLYPRACRRAALNLARLLFGQRQWEAAQSAYATATDAMEALYQAAVTEPGRQAELAQARDVFANRAYALARLGRLGEAAACLESGRARAVGQALARNTALLAAAPDDEQRAFAAARDHLAALEAEARWADDLFDADPARPRPARDPVTIMDELAQARAEFDDVVARLRTRVPGFLPSDWAAADLEEVAQQVAQPLIYLEATRFGGLALIVPPGAPVLAVWLDALDADGLAEPLARYLSDSTSGEAGALSRTLAALWPTLDEACLRPIIEALQRLGHSQAVLIPGGLLGLLPLPAVAAGAVAFSCAPSARALQAAHAGLRRRAAQPDRWLGVGSPTNTLKILPFADLEVREIHALFAAGAPTVLSDAAATRAAVAAALPGATHIHFACHGKFNPQQPLESTLSLAGDDGLSLRHVLEGGADLAAARLVVLSACETGLIDVRHAPDEVVGFPAGFLQAGASGVVSSLWSVDDLSTALLMVQFYTGQQREGAAPAEALRRAQLWLRAVTNAELSERFDDYLQDTAGPALSPRAQAAAQAKFLEFTLAAPNEQPFKHPYFWAPFVYYGA